jgi:TolB-like protein
MKYPVLAILIQATSCLPAAFADATDAQAQPPITVAALPFHEASAKETYAPLAEAIGDMVVVRLSAAEGLVFVNRSAIDKVLKEHESSLLMSQADRIRLGRIVGAKFVLTGSVTTVGDEFQVNAHLLDVSTARVARSAKATARSDRLTEPIDKLAQELVGELNLKLPELTPEQIDKSPEANLHFLRGLGYYFAKLPDDAIVEFMKVLAIDPFHARARFWNGMAYFDQGEYEHAKLEFARFLKQSGQHALAPRARDLLGQCEAPPRKPRQGESP